MFKKVIALFVALMLLVSVTSALAETVRYKMIEDFEDFDMEVEIPEGAEYRQNAKDGWLCLEIWFDDASKPEFDLNVSPSDDLDHLFLADFPQEDIDHLMEMIGENFSAPEYEFFDTPSGNRVLLTRETDPEAGDYASMDSIYKGFSFSLYCRHADYAPLTEDDMKLMHQIIEGAWIIDRQK